MRRLRYIAWILVVLPGLSLSTKGDEPFYLKDGDRVVFYGDSITDQRLYTVFTETFAVTRFPKAKVTFIHSGWGGDSVNGGGGGPIDVRLKRDVFAYKPTVMTVMLGMNDASYRLFDPMIFENYTKGYRHIVESVKKNAPGIRMTLIRPSPFDDVTRPPAFEGGYNAVLIRYGDFVQELAGKNGLDVADLNSYVVDATKKAFASEPEKAKELNPDRVHPSPSCQLLMAAALLKAWHAPAVVSEVEMVVNGEPKATSRHAEVTDLRLSDGSLAWTQLDESLPFPADLKDPQIELAVNSSDFIASLNQQRLKVSGLAAGNYTLKIDNEDFGHFKTEELAKGVNLATIHTPMFRQAAAVHALTVKHNNVHFIRWRQIQVPPITSDEGHLLKAMDAMDAIEADIVGEQRAKAQPKPHKFELSREK